MAALTVRRKPSFTEFPSPSPPLESFGQNLPTHTFLANIHTKNTFRRWNVTDCYIYARNF
jgi:hypothetical protein